MLPSVSATLAEKEAPHWVVLARFDTNPPLRIWTGPGAFDVPGDDVLDPGAEYDGIGLLVGMPSFRQLIGGEFERLEIVLDGTWPILRNNLFDPDYGLYGAACSIGIAFLDDDYQLADSIAWFYDAAADVVTDSRQDMTDRLTISVTSGEALAMRAMLVYWTDTNHRRRHPTDGFWRRAGLYGPQWVPKWG